MIFQNPWVLLALPPVLGAIFYAENKRRHSSVRFSSGEFLEGIRPSVRIRLRRHLVLIKVLALFLLIVALARPRIPLERTRTHTEGIDIVLAVDTSTSMRAEDFMLGSVRLNRLDVVKTVIEDFVNKRPNDRIGMVAFASRAYTVSPLTLDHDWLLKNLERVHIGMIEDGTAIGSGISSALNRLKGTEAKSKVIILLTDGRNNTGRISPLTAANAAKVLGIKVYTIGAGSRGPVPYPMEDMFGRTVYKKVKIDIDEGTLEKIAGMTQARYFRATDTESLRRIYDEIDKLETYPIEETGYTEYRELCEIFLIPALFIFLVGVFLDNALLRRIP